MCRFLHQPRKSTERSRHKRTTTRVSHTGFPSHELHMHLSSLAVQCLSLKFSYVQVFRCGPVSQCQWPLGLVERQ